MRLDEEYFFQKTTDSDQLYYVIKQVIKYKVSFKPIEKN